MKYIIDFQNIIEVVILKNNNNAMKIQKFFKMLYKLQYIKYLNIFIFY